jgi:predicted nucleic acid-binding protein
MTTVFADSFYFIALLSPADDAHTRSVDFTRQFQGHLVTTQWVLTEVADGFGESRARSQFVKFLDRLNERADVTVIPCSADYFELGMNLYRTRLDKEWSLTDCISFVVMQEKRIIDALTGDHHFEQAGYNALLK